MNNWEPNWKITNDIKNLRVVATIYKRLCNNPMRKVDKEGNEDRKPK